MPRFPRRIPASARFPQSALFILAACALAPRPAAAVSAAKIEVIEPGAEPRAELAIKAPPATTENVNLVTNIDIKAVSQGREVPSTKAPELDLRGMIQTEKHKQKGVIQYVFTVLELRANGKTRESKLLVPLIEAQADTIRGKSYKGLINTRGERLTRAVDTGKDEVAKLVGDQSEKFLTMIFPSEPVGVGAKWVITEQIQMEGAVVDQASTVQLIARKRDVLILKLTIEGKAKQQRLASPQSNPAAKVELVSLAMQGLGEMTFDLRKPVPVKSDVRTVMDMKTRTSAGGQKVDIDQHYAVTQSIRESDPKELIAGTEASAPNSEGAPKPARPEPPTPERKAADAEARRVGDLKQANDTMEIAREAWNNKEYENALALAEKVLDFRKPHLPADHPDIEQVNKMIARAKEILAQRAAENPAAAAPADPAAPAPGKE